MEKNYNQWGNYKNAYEAIDWSFEELKNIATKEGVVIKLQNENTMKEWKSILEKVEKHEYDINEKQTKLYVRGYGRQHDVEDLKKLYKTIFYVEIKKDGNNNSRPQALAKAGTGWQRYNKSLEEKTEQTKKKYSVLYNYQVSHVWGMTLNPFLFTAPWNICYLAKFLDPFTGHESKGETTKMFAKWFKEEFYTTFKAEIEEYNNFLIRYKTKDELSIIEAIEKYIKENPNLPKDFAKEIKNNWQPISLN